MSYDSLYRSINKGDFAPVTYLTGDEDILKEELIQKAIDTALDPGTLDFNLDVRTAGDLSPESLVALVDTPPMMAERRFVVVKSLEQWRKNSRQWQALRNYAGNPSGTTILFLTHRVGGTQREADPTLKSAARHAEIGRLEPHRLVRWIGMHAEKSGVTFTDGAAQHLVKVVGSDLALLATEVKKLAASAEDSTVAERDVEIMVGVNHGETVSDWIDCVIEQRTTTAISLLDVILPQPGVNGVRLVMNLGTVLVAMRFARALLDGGGNDRQVEKQLVSAFKSAKAAGIGGWGVEAARCTRAARRWSAARLDRALRTAYGTDRTLKSTGVTGERGTLINMLLAMGTTGGER